MRGTKPTRTQRQVLEKNKLDPLDYEITKAAGTGWVIRHIKNGTTNIIYPDKKGVYMMDGQTLLS